jgi:arsenite-transporting ATPase
VQRYLSQFHDLYEDFHVLELPLLADEIRGVDALRDFSSMLMMSDAERRALVRDMEPDAPDAEGELSQLRTENASLRAALATRGGQAPS